jgi:predicted helicase
MSSLASQLGKLSSNSFVRARQFEDLTKWCLATDPSYEPERRQVWRWKDWPGRGRRKDLGIDLGGDTYEAEYWAIGAKAHDFQYPIKKAAEVTGYSASRLRR